jgi:hypothetical protein
MFGKMNIHNDRPFSLCSGPYNTYLTYGNLFHEHPVYSPIYNKYDWKAVSKKVTVIVTIIIVDKTCYKHTPKSVTSLGQAVGQTLHTERCIVHSDFWQQAFVQFRCAVSWVFNEAVKLVKLVISESRTLATVKYTFTELPKHSHRDADTQTAIP